MFVTAPRADAGGMDRSPWGQFWFQPVGQTRGGQRVTPSAVMGLPTAFACVQVLAQSFAVLPPKLYKRSKDGKARKQVRDHWLHRLLAQHPNRWQTPYEWRLMMQGHLALRGNAYNQITANGRGEITELLPLHPDRMSIETVATGGFRYRYVDAQAQVHYYAPAEIWHLRGLSDDGYMGMSVLQCAAAALGEGLALQDYSSRFFANDAKPGGGWIEYPGQFASKQAKSTFRESWQELQGGTNRGKVAVLERGMKFHELGLTNKDSQFIEAKNYKDKDIARLFRVPPHKVGILDNATFSNIEQQAIEFWQDTMLPICEMWESSAEYWLLGQDGPNGDLELEFDMARMMRGDGVARAERISTLVMAGVMTRNEGRDEEGLAPVDGLDEPLRPLNMIEEGDEPPVPGATPAPRPAPGKPPAKPAAPPADDDEEARRATDVQARMQALLRGNASRMARRLAAGNDVSADTMAAAMAVDAAVAATWLGTLQPLALAGAGAEAITAALLPLAGVAP